MELQFKNIINDEDIKEYIDRLTSTDIDCVITDYKTYDIKIPFNLSFRIKESRSKFLTKALKGK